MSVTINFENIIKKYGEITVIPNLSLEINEGEFFTLLGPSGCGKTTLLRMVAGFNTIEGGSIRFNDQEINNLTPGKRNIGMVFQNYAIFPHMNVKQNVAFGLTNKKIPKDDIEKRVAHMLKTVQIEEYQERMPENLSGGQQQRVALARAIVMEPDVLLMDEPLSNLDAKLRVDMRNAIKEIQNDINITTIYVTHDQEEAMAVSDRIAIMDKGMIQQVGTPQEIYQRPDNLFVATFIGHTNVLAGTLQAKADMVVLQIGGYQLPLHHVAVKTSSESLKKVQVSVRPEEFILCESPDNQGIKGKIASSIFLGMNTHYFIVLETGEKVEIVQQSTIQEIHKPGTTVQLRINAEKINIFREDGKVSLMKGGSEYDS